MSVQVFLTSPVPNVQCANCWATLQFAWIDLCYHKKRGVFYVPCPICGEGACVGIGQIPPFQVAAARKRADG